MRDVQHAFHADTDAITESGHVYLFAWLYERWSDDAARHIIWQFAIFYGLLLVGFVFLYVMIKSTGQVRSQLKEIRRNMAEALHAEKERKWDLDDYNKASLGVGFM